MAVREKFKQCVLALYEKKMDNAAIMTQECYQNVTHELKEIALHGPRQRKDYRRMARYEIISIGDDEKVVQKGTNKYFITIEDSFDVLEEAHIATGHGGRNVMAKYLSEKYANITREMIMIFLKLCESCHLKKAKTRKSNVVKPIMSDEGHHFKIPDQDWALPANSMEGNSTTRDWNTRCQVDLIDMHSQPDGSFKFILVYQDHKTKFCCLRALLSKTAVEVADCLIDIFCDKGAPNILHTNNGREFASKIIKEVLRVWPHCKLVHGKPRHKHSQGSMERDVKAKLSCWMKDNRTEEWSKGLRFVQMAKNTCFHTGIGRSPYAALFGSEPKLGLTSLNLPKEVIARMECEEDLEKLFYSKVGNSNTGTRMVDNEPRTEDAGKSSESGELQGFATCKCAMGCQTNRCQCRAKKVKCNSKCHGRSTCCNM